MYGERRRSSSMTLSKLSIDSATSFLPAAQRQRLSVSRATQGTAWESEGRGTEGGQGRGRDRLKSSMPRLVSVDGRPGSEPVYSRSAGGSGC